MSKAKTSWLHITRSKVNPVCCPEFVTDLIDRKAAVIVAVGGIDPAKAAKAVFISAADPLSAGIVTRLNRPEGNITGISHSWHIIGGQTSGASPRYYSRNIHDRGVGQSGLFGCRSRAARSGGSGKPGQATNPRRACKQGIGVRRRFRDQNDRVRRVGVLMGFAEDDAVWQNYLATFRQRLQDFGWTDGCELPELVGLR